MFSFFGPRTANAPEPPLLEALDPEWSSLAKLLHPTYKLQRVLRRSDHDVLLARDAQERQFAVSAWYTARYDAEEWLRRFRREQSVARQLRHPSITSVVDVGAAGEWAWSIAPYVDAEPLSAWLARGPMDPQRARRWLQQMMEALSYAHGLGVVHRALEPDVISIGRLDERVSITHFGIPVVRHTCQAGSPTDISGVHYLSPESIQGEGMGPASDFYSLGVLAFAMLTGRTPFEGSDPIQVIIKTLTEAPTRITQLRPELPESLADLVDRLLSKQPELRLKDQGQALRLLHVRSPETPPECEAAADLMHQLREQGERVTADSMFSLDAAVALEKLRQFQFVEPHTFLVALCAAAVQLNSSRLEIQSAPGKLKLTYQGVFLRADQMLNLWAYAFTSADSGGLRHLALGLAGALGEKGASLKVSSSGSVFALGRVEPPQTAWFWKGPLTIELQGTFRATVENLAPRLAYCPLPICWNAKMLAPGLRPNRPELTPGDDVFRVHVDLDKPLQWVAVVDGVAFPLPHRAEPSGLVVVWGSLPIDLSYGHLVYNDRLTALLEALDGTIDAAIEFYADGDWNPAQSDHVLRRALSLWKQRGEGERIERLYTKVLANKAGSSLLHDACQHFHTRSNKPQAFWQVLTRIELLRPCDSTWSFAVEVSKNAFSVREEALRWLLQIWLGEDPRHRPSLDEIESLLSEVGSFDPAPHDARLQMLIREGLLHNATQEQVQRFVAVVPQRWTLTKTEAEGWIDVLGN